MKKVVGVVSAALLGIVSVIFLQLYAKNKEATPNGFERRIVPNVLSSAKHYHVGSSSVYIISLDSAGVRLGSSTESGRVLHVPYSLSKVDSSLLDLPDSIRFAWGAAKFMSFCHRIFLEEGISPNIFEMDSTLIKQRGDTSRFPSFDLLAPFDSGFACRTLDTIGQKYTIRILGDKGPIVYANSILTVQQEGLFSCDGMLFFDDRTRRLIYVYYYRNELTSFTSSLDTVSRGKTIDTISWAHITVHAIKSERKATFSSPPLKVNKHACTWNGHLFIYSALRADNEKGKLAFTSSAIDVYAIHGFKYLGSFYLPNNDGEGIRDFAVFNDHLVALRGEGIFVFTLNMGAITAGK